VPRGLQEGFAASTDEPEHVRSGRGGGHVDAKDTVCHLGAVEEHAGGGERGADGPWTPSNTRVSCRLGGCSFPGIASVAQVSVGREHAGAVLADGTLLCWGGSQQSESGNVGGTTSCGNPPIACALAPTREPGLAQVRAVCAGYFHTCALLQSGSVQCWGANSSGELGNGGTSLSNPTPGTVVGF
jgi:hypothetical protein